MVEQQLHAELKRRRGIPAEQRVAVRAKMQQRQQHAEAERARVETEVQQDRMFKRSLDLAATEAAKAKFEAAAALRRVRLEELRVRSIKQASAGQVDEAIAEKREFAALLCASCLP